MKWRVLIIIWSSSELLLTVTFSVSIHLLSLPRNTYSVNRRKFSSRLQTSRMLRKIKKKILTVIMTTTMTNQKIWRMRWNRGPRRRDTASTTSSLWPNRWLSPLHLSRHGKGKNECRGPTPARCWLQTPSTTLMNIAGQRQRHVSFRLRALVTTRDLSLSRSQQQQQVKSQSLSGFIKGYWNSIS